MTYKKKLIVLLSVIAALTLIYTASLVFDPERTAARSASYVWMDSRLVSRVNRIVLSSEGESRELVKKNNEWFVLYNGNEYPARQARIEDFLALFTKRTRNPVLYSNAASHTRLGLDVETASRITVYGENSTLDLLLGYNTGNEVYMRRVGQNEVRSGEYLITVYLRGAAGSWYNLKLFPESEDGGITAYDVQRLSVYTEGEPLIFSRSNRGWAVSGAVITDPDQSIIESYVNTVLITEGDNFSDIPIDAPELNHSRIILELGNGSVRTIRLSEEDEEGRRLAHVSGSRYVYSLPAWSVQRLFRDASSFEGQY